MRSFPVFGALAASTFAESTQSELAQGGTLRLDWKDCGAKHGKVTGLTPTLLALGQETAVTGSGSVDEEITGGKFSLEVKAGGGIVHKTFHGDICEASTFELPIGAGSITWDGLGCPIAAGKVSVGTKIKMSGALPASLAQAAIVIKGEGAKGEDLLCMGIDTTPAAAAEAPVEEKFVWGDTLALRWRDYSGKGFIGEVIGLSPGKSSICPPLVKSCGETTLALGKETAVTIIGSFNKAVTGGMIFLEVEAGGGIVKFNGDICSTSTFDLPMSAGSITWDGLKCPVAAGDVKAGTKIKLAGALPASLAQATISIKGENNQSDNLFLLGVITMFPKPLSKTAAVNAPVQDSIVV